jgi:ABC-2 type transport system permease protein
MNAGADTHATARTQGGTRRASSVVLRTEWALMRVERATAAAIVLLSLAAGYAAFTGRNWSTSQRETRAAIARDDVRQRSELRRQLDSLAGDPTPPAAFGDPRNPYTAGTRSARQYAVLPMSRFAAAAIGQADLLPSYHRVSMLSRETFFVNDEIENPVNLLAGRFDLAFFTVVLFPLVILGLSYNTLAADRESGTLAMLLAQPVSARALLSAKIGARAVVLLGLVVAVTVVVLITADVETTARATWIRAALWLAVVVSYGAFWFVAALAVNVTRMSSATNALALLAFWLVATVLLPSLVNLGVATRYPVPSRVALVRATRDASNAAAARGSQLLGMYYQDHPELMSGGVPTADFGTRTIAVQQEVDRAVKPVLQAFDAQLDRQQQAARRWRLVSPALLAYDALTIVAGTNTERFGEFEHQVDAYMTTLQAFFTPRVVHGAAFDAAAVAAIPRFAFRDASPGAVVRNVLPAIALLLLGSIVIGLAALLSIKRPSALV